MKITILILCFICTFLFQNQTSFAQKAPKEFTRSFILSKEEEEAFEHAEFLFQEGDYESALPIFLDLDIHYPGEPLYTYRVGICYLNKKTEENKSVDYLEDIYKTKPELDDINYHLGRAHQLSFNFDKAVSYFEKFISVDPNDKKVWEAKKNMHYCKNAPAILSNPNKSHVANLGDSINTLYAEYAPVVFNDSKNMFYTFRGDSLAIGNFNEGIIINPMFEYFEDVYKLTKQPWGTFGNPKREPEPINSNKSGRHDASVSISDDGKVLFIYKDKATREGGDILYMLKEGDSWSNPKAMAELNTKYWEGSAAMSADENTIVFSSDRPGGKGGKDLYVTKKQADGKFGEAINLVNENTEFNEDGPFLSFDGKILYFSSEGHNSIGGYDLFSCDILADGTFGKPKNLGYPVNSLENDIFMSTTPDGKMAYLSSDRAGGYGQMDLYSFETMRMNQFTHLATIIGTVTADGKPTEAQVHVYDEQGKNLGTFNSGLLNGKYKIPLSGAAKYKLVFESKNYSEKETIVDINNLTAAITKTVDMDLTEALAAVTPDKKKVEAPVASETPKASNTESKTTEPIKTQEPKTSETLAANNNPVKETSVKANEPKSVNDVKEATTAKTPTLSDIPALSIEVRKVYFGYDQYQVSPSDFKYLNNLASVLSKTKSVKIEVHGHADGKGSDEYNQALSQRRANAVAEYLVVRGVERGRITVIAKGESMPALPNENTDGSDNPNGRAKNRRTEIKLNVGDGSDKLNVKYVD